MSRGRAATLALLLGAICVALLLAGCSGGGSEDLPIPRITEAKAERDVVDGAARLTTTVTVRFDRTLKFAPRRVPLASLFEIAVDTGNGEQRVLAKTAEQAKDSARVIRLTIDGLIPDGAELRMQKKAFQPKTDGNITAKITSSLDDILAVLASQALEPTNPAFAETPAKPAVTDADRDPAAVRKLLEAHLRDRGSPDDVVKRALDRYDGMPATVQGPKARAALAALTGTFAEAAIDNLLTANNCTGKPAAKIAFQVPPDVPELFARVTYAADGARIVSLNPSIEGERLEDLMPIVAHEAIHCDQQGSTLEEIVAASFDTFLYLNLLAAFPELADVTTPLGHDLNFDALAMFNSGRKYPELIGVLPSVGVKNALPGSEGAVHPSFADLIAAAYAGQPPTSPEEPLARTYARVLAAAAKMKDGSPFDLAYLDELLGLSLDPGVYAVVIGAFGLTPPG